MILLNFKYSTDVSLLLSRHSNNASDTVLNETRNTPHPNKQANKQTPDAYGLTANTGMIRVMRAKSLWRRAPHRTPFCHRQQNQCTNGENNFWWASQSCHIVHAVYAVLAIHSCFDGTDNGEIRRNGFFNGDSIRLNCLDGWLSFNKKFICAQSDGPWR